MFVKQIPEYIGRALPESFTESMVRNRNRNRNWNRNSNRNWNWAGGWRAKQSCDEGREQQQCPHGHLQSCEASEEAAFTVEWENITGNYELVTGLQMAVTRADTSDSDYSG